MDKLRQRLKKADWWEITYLIIYSGVFTFEFLNTTMFEIKWPPRFGYIFLASTALYVIAKFIWHNTYTKKEMIGAGIILFAFLMPALLTEYRFLWYAGFLIVGAKDIDFNKILKVYLVIGITIMVAAFGASQMGWIENLVYVLERNGETFMRHSFGTVYPTDYAAHIFYLILAFSVYMEKKLKPYIVALIGIFASAYVYVVSNARTSMVCLLGFSILYLVIYLCRNYKKIMGQVLQWTPVICSSFFLGLAYNYQGNISWMRKIDDLLSGRLLMSKTAFDAYSIKLFGQDIYEIGYGRGTGDRDYYFFLDDVYIRILLEYGVILFVVTICMMVFISHKNRERMLLIVVIVVISVHSIMEHHLLEIAYNPFILTLFAQSVENERIDRRKNV